MEVVNDRFINDQITIVIDLMERIPPNKDGNQKEHDNGR
jgi:hypothetical protein